MKKMIVRGMCISVLASALLMSAVFKGPRAPRGLIPGFKPQEGQYAITLINATPYDLEINIMNIDSFDTQQDNITAVLPAGGTLTDTSLRMRYVFNGIEVRKKGSNDPFVWPEHNWLHEYRPSFKGTIVYDENANVYSIVDKE